VYVGESEVLSVCVGSFFYCKVVSCAAVKISTDIYDLSVVAEPLVVTVEQRLPSQACLFTLSYDMAENVPRNCLQYSVLFSFVT